MITNYINSIQHKIDFSISTGKDESIWVFCGDGTGDWEQMEHSADPVIVQNYIENCYEQIRLAENYLAQETLRNGN